MLKIELDIFSGRPNPSWLLTPQEENELVERVLADSALMRPMTAETGGLGYRGYIVTAMSEDGGAWSQSAKGKAQRLPSSFRIGGQGGERDAALWLLDTSDKADAEVDDYLRDAAEKQIIEPRAVLPQEAQPDSSAVEPSGARMTCYSNYLYSPYDFSFWNGAAYVRLNNCYAFASNWRNNTFAQPGRAAGRKFTALNCSNIRAAINADGWREACVARDNITSCLVIWPGQDYHFYRLCANGIWCHKPGRTPARNYDDSGRIIRNPETCNRGYYTVFCGYEYASRYVPVI